MKDISIIYKCDPTTICNILKIYKIKSRTLSEARRNYLNYTIDENVFSIIDSPDKAYWLGVMYSDGYITKNKYTCSFGLSVQAKDIEWLNKFKQFLKYNGDIHHYKTASSSYKVDVPYVRLLIGNNKIVQDLINLGVTYNKSKKLTSIPNIPYKLAFIRGYIDGDGSLLKKYPCIQISGTKQFLLSIANFLQIPFSLYQDKTIYNLKYNTKQSEYLEKILYKNANSYLDRKYLIAKRSFNSPLTLKDVKEKSLKLRESLIES